MKSLVSAMILAIVLGIALAGCSTGGDDDPGEEAQIPANAAIITFAGGGAWGDVVFTHATHANEYYDGTCVFCHDHETLGTESHWSCGECHSAGQDAEELCAEYANHGCIMTQCQDCHLREGGNLAPDGDSCSDCHEFPDYAETIVFPGGAGYGPVVFTHMKHANDYYEGECLDCHDHDEGEWSCGDCHTSGADAEGLCDEKVDHGCIMTQCQDCHADNSPPAPDGKACGHCHGFPPYAETITFNGGNCESVTFTHQQHALEYSDGMCRDCHHMEASYWVCRLCHTLGEDPPDDDGDCEEILHHGCIMTQCQDCHADNSPPAPDGSLCVHCHTGCGCPPPDGQDPCDCTDCHDTYPVAHEAQDCTKAGCHVSTPIGFHTSWLLCSTGVCHPSGV